MVVENKSDMPNVRWRVINEKGRPFADDNGLLLAETSTQDSIGVESVFVEIAQKAYDHLRESSDVGEQGQTEKILPFTNMRDKSRGACCFKGLVCIPPPFPGAASPNSTPIILPFTQ
ncbi:hypothetical protein BGZ93_004795 [Podila epicladia]|nr:hypothetical protein BGZ93_004795 [Podila epicladia]